MESLRVRVERAISEKVFPGCVIGYIRHGSDPVIRSFGSLAYDMRPVREDSVYDLASITKSIPTASLVSMLIHEKVLSLRDEIKKFVPELQNDFGATIEDLLRYRVTGPRMAHMHLTTPEAVQNHIFERGFDGPPGDSSYSNLPAYLLGLTIERVSDKNLDVFSRERFFGLLGMDDTTFFPLRADCVPSERDVSDDDICGIVHDESARLFIDSKKTVGHAGLFSTAADLLTFLDSLIYGRFPTVVQDAEVGLGWSVHAPWFMGAHAGGRAFGKTGFTGTSVIADASQKTALVILSNRTYPKRPPDATSLNSAINVLRRDIADIVFTL